MHHTQVEVIAFLGVAMELFDDPTDQPDTVEIYRPAGANPYSIPEAQLRILRLLAEAGQSQTLDRLLPEEILKARANHQKIGMCRARAALGTTFIASLEMAKQGNVAMDQDAFLAPIRLRVLVEMSGETPVQRPVFGTSGKNQDQIVVEPVPLMAKKYPPGACVKKGRWSS